MIGAAALRGNVEVLRFVLAKVKSTLKVGSIDFLTFEKLDEKQSMAKPLI